MTHDEAEQYRWLVKEIALLEHQLSELEKRYGTMAAHDPVIRQDYESIRALLDTRMSACIARCERFERQISQVEDPLIQNALLLRFVDGLAWVQVGARLGCKYEAVKQAVHRYFEKEERLEDQHLVHPI